MSIPMYATVVGWAVFHDGAMLGVYFTEDEARRTIRNDDDVVKEIELGRLQWVDGVWREVSDAGKS